MNKFIVIILLIAAVVGGYYYWKTVKIKNQNLLNNPRPTSKTEQKISPTATTLAANKRPQAFPTNTWVTNATQATITTPKGNIVIKLYPQDAPKTVTNFATLAKSGFYNGLTFHRVVPGFVIQGGDPLGNGSGGYSIYGQTFQDELNPNAPSYQAGYLQGVVAMANRGPNTNGSQFFIMLADTPSLPKNYTIFGKVTQGMNVVQQIAIGDKMISVNVQ